MNAVTQVLPRSPGPGQIPPPRSPSGGIPTSFQPGQRTEPQRRRAAPSHGPVLSVSSPVKEGRRPVNDDGLTYF